MRYFHWAMLALLIFFFWLMAPRLHAAVPPESETNCWPHAPGITMCWRKEFAPRARCFLTYIIAPGVYNNWDGTLGPRKERCK